MLSFFTDPYPNELLYSAFARFHFYSGSIDLKDSLTELFGKNSVIPTFEIGNHLNFLCDKLGGNYTPEQLIQNHTLLPFYLPFLPRERKEELLHDIIHTDGKGIYTKLGIVAGSICKKEEIYYCPSCVKEDMEKLGETYIYREHQLQGVMMCPHHQRILNKYSIKRHDNSRIEFIRIDGVLLEQVFDSCLVQEKYHDKLIQIAEAAYYLLVNDLSYISKADILLRYKNLLYAMNLTTNKFRVKQEELHDRVVNHYGNDLLDFLESGLDKNDEYNWLRVATRNVERTVHPLRHILLILFLAGDMDNFFKGIHQQQPCTPFGRGPWPCLNKAAEHYQQNVVKHLAVTADYRTRKPVGTFTCDCGYVYSRTGPDQSTSDRYRKGRVKAFGTVWKEKLRTLLYEKRWSYRQLASQMGCDIKTIYKFKALFAEPDAFNCNIEAEMQQRLEFTMQEKYKDKLLGMVKAYPELSRTEIRKFCKKEYAFFYRHDKRWLFELLPAKKSQTGCTGYINWNQRDHEILLLLQKAYITLLNREKLIRISKTALGKVINKLSMLEKNLDKLPYCAEFIYKVSETKPEFQLRRCHKIAMKMKDESLPLLEWKIQRQAGLRKEDYELIKDKLNLILRENDRELCYG